MTFYLILFLAFCLLYILIFQLTLDILSGILSDIYSDMLFDSLTVFLAFKRRHSTWHLFWPSFWCMFGSICAQRDLELEIGVRIRTCPQPALCSQECSGTCAPDSWRYSLRVRVFLHLSWHLLRGLGLLTSMVTTSWRKKARRSGADAEG